ncbi:flagellar filament capping protein FliD [Dechloromonas denitrificans]|uniref:flagellar filament capping protein FliD n=1 Tax=Dechloromonas denitrificans TaxID=281362 RepID=UPI001CFAB87C|nr:flagellar filament capping protein FliD [Dechloromonas denitrificans]UCV08959.1 flagellar filament capping protein FliD [Dechloromonas denitrificans]
MTDINPASMASQLANAYTQPTQSLLTTQSQSVKAASNALSSLQSALQTFDNALTSLSAKKSLQQYSATFSASGFGSVTAAPTAQPGTYSLFVEQLASANQISFQDLPAIPVASGGPLTVSLAGGASFNVNLAGADADSDGTLSQAEIARAINQASGNGGQVSAMLVTVSGQTQMILSATSTGAASQITLDASALPASPLKTALAAGNQLVAARDAVVWLGAQGSGVKLQQASNTFTAIPGVSMSFTQAMATGAAPLTLSVASDDAGTAANVSSFVDAYNALNKVLDQLTDSGNPESSTAAGAFASDAGVRALRSRLSTLIHQQIGGLRLMDFGINADRYGNLSLNKDKLQKTLAANPDGLTTLFGNTGATTSSGVLGTLDKYLGSWLNSTVGQIKRRQESVQNMQKAITARQTRLDDQYSKSYQRYLVQFTRLQQLQSQMSQTTDMFANLSSASG